MDSGTASASRYESGRCRDWVKAKNPEAPAVTRLAGLKSQVFELRWGPR